MPDSIVLRLQRRLAVSMLKAWQALRIVLYRAVSTCKMDGPRPRIVQPLLCTGKGAVTFGRDVQIGFFPSPYFLTSVCHIEARAVSARVEIGEGTILNNEFVALAEGAGIKMGKRCRIGPRCTIMDSDFHGLAVQDRDNPEAIRRLPVDIVDDVFFGASVTVLKGVRVGAGSVIAAGSVVTGDIPAGVIAGGNPAKVIRPL